VWSAENGQDDLVWYGGLNQGNGRWTSTFNPASHTGYGQYYTHVYRNSSSCDTADFTRNAGIPAAPAGLSAVCNADGTSVTFTWGAVANATGYYFRNDDQQVSACGSWYCQSPPDVLTDPIAQTTYTINGTVPGHTNSWWVHSNNAAGYSAPTYSSIVCSGQANLTAGSVYADSAITSGVATTLYSNTYNAGAAATGVSSVTAFQRATDAAGSNATTIGFFTVGNIAAAGQQQASTGHTFPSTGPWFMRTCVDWNGQVTESDEGNCGGWEAISVSAPLPVCSNGVDDDGDGTTDYPADTGCSSANDTTDGPNLPTASLSASLGTISTGDASLLTWSSTGATACTGTGFTAGGTSGTRSVSPVTPGANSYSMTCTGPGGTSLPAFATVTVITPTAYITAQPTLVRSGGSTSLLWSATEATSCTITPYQGTTALSPIFSGAPAVGTTTTAAPNITRQTDYRLSCTTLTGGNTSSSIQVNVRFEADEF